MAVPLFFKKQGSMVTAGEGVNVHQKAVRALVSWAATPSECERDAGMEGSAITQQVSVHAQPELKLPTKGEKDLNWSSTDAVHRYSFIEAVCGEGRG